MRLEKNLSRALNKIQKMITEQEASFVLKKTAHLTIKKLSPSPDRRTKLKRQLIFEKLNENILNNDIESSFSAGLLRASNDIKLDIRRLPIDIAERLVDKAEDILKNEYTIYGTLKVSCNSDSIYWLRDPLTDFVWPMSLTHGFIKGQKPYGTDIKTIWEIARFQFLSTLAYAYCLTGEERFANFAFQKTESWIDSNPFLQGPHWKMPMESSIRILNWCVYLPLLDIFEYSDGNFKTKLARSILEHFIYIQENIEVSFSQAGNHYLADLVGLLLTHALFPGLNDLTKGTGFVKKELEKEILNQFKRDGINFEGSLHYHRLSSEMILIGVALIKRMGLDISSPIAERLRQIASFTRYYTDKCDECPIIGDNDSGIFLRLFPEQELNSHGYLNSLFDAILYDRCEPLNSKQFLSSVHFTKTSLTEASENNEKNGDSKSQFQIKNFDGLIIARHGNETLFFNVLNSTQGHSHNDKLSIHPLISGKLLFVDRGSFSYSGFHDKRHKDRISASHNNPLVNNWEQNTLWEDDLFYNNGEAKCFSSTDHSDRVLEINGWHHGYERFRKGLTTYRRVNWNTEERTLLISDWLEGETAGETFQLTWHFLINPIWSSSILSNCVAFTCKNQTVYFEDLDKIDFNIIQSHYCPAYQVEKNCEALIASTKIRIGKKIRFNLRY